MESCDTSLICPVCHSCLKHLRMSIDPEVAVRVAEAREGGLVLGTASVVADVVVEEGNAEWNKSKI